MSVFLFGSVFLWSKESTESADSAPGRSLVNEFSVYLGALVLMVGVFLVFNFNLVTLPSAYLPDRLVSRPAELVPALFFGAAFVGYLRRGAWRTEPFQYWLLIGLLISTFLHGMYMAQATSEFDGIGERNHWIT